MDATLWHVADDEIANRHVIDVLVVRPERGLRVRGVTRRPAGAVEDCAGLADKSISRLRRDGAPQKMCAGSETERSVTWMTIDGRLDVVAGRDTDAASRTGNAGLRTTTWRRRNNICGTARRLGSQLHDEPSDPSDNTCHNCHEQ